MRSRFCSIAVLTICALAHLRASADDTPSIGSRFRAAAFDGVLAPSNVFRETSAWTLDAGHSGHGHSHSGGDGHRSGRRGLADEHGPAGIMGEHLH